MLCNPIEHGNIVPINSLSCSFSGNERKPAVKGSSLVVLWDFHCVIRIVINKKFENWPTVTECISNNENSTKYQRSNANSFHINYLSSRAKICILNHKKINKTVYCKCVNNSYNLKWDPCVLFIPPVSIICETNKKEIKRNTPNYWESDLFVAHSPKIMIFPCFH